MMSRCHAVDNHHSEFRIWILFKINESSKHQQLEHFRDCRYQPVHGKNNIIVHGCKNDIRIYDRRMPLKSFSTIKLSDKSIPTSVILTNSMSLAVSYLGIKSA